VSQARYLDTPKPSYPEIARRKGREGRVLLRVLVDDQGRTKTVEINSSSGNEALDRAAAEAVKRWHFQPARYDATKTIEAFSAGSRPKPLHPHARRVMRERGIDLAGQRSKHLGVFADTRFHWVITLCDRVREVCPEFPGGPEAIHWSIPDPAATDEDDEATYPAFQQTAAELETRIGFLLAVLSNPTTTGAPEAP
jgi:TonB family protein